MKLNEIGLPHDSFVSIGSGTAYFFIGRLGEFLESAGVYDNRFREQADEKLKVARDKVKAIIDGLRNDPGNLSLIDKLESARRVYKKTLDGYIHYTEVLDREVLDIYERSCDPGVGIKIEGDESGSLWLYSERVDSGKGECG